MSLLDKVKGLIGGNKDQVKGGIDKGAGIADDRTGNKYTSQIDTGSEKAKDVVDGMDDN